MVLWFHRWFLLLVSCFASCVALAGGTASFTLPPFCTNVNWAIYGCVANLGNGWYSYASGTHTGDPNPWTIAVTNGSADQIVGWRVDLSGKTGYFGAMGVPNGSTNRWTLGGSGCQVSSVPPSSTNQTAGTSPSGLTNIVKFTNNAPYSMGYNAKLNGTSAASGILKPGEVLTWSQNLQFGDEAILETTADNTPWLVGGEPLIAFTAGTSNGSSGGGTGAPLLTNIPNPLSLGTNVIKFTPAASTNAAQATQEGLNGIGGIMAAGNAAELEVLGKIHSALTNLGTGSNGGTTVVSNTVNITNLAATNVTWSDEMKGWFTNYIGGLFTNVSTNGLLTDIYSGTNAGAGIFGNPITKITDIKAQLESVMYPTIPTGAGEDFTVSFNTHPGTWSLNLDPMSNSAIAEGFTLFKQFITWTLLVLVFGRIFTGLRQSVAEVAEINQARSAGQSFLGTNAATPMALYMALAILAVIASGVTVMLTVAFGNLGGLIVNFDGGTFGSSSSYVRKAWYLMNCAAPVALIFAQVTWLLVWEFGRTTFLFVCVALIKPLVGCLFWGLVFFPFLSSAGLLVTGPFLQSGGSYKIRVTYAGDFPSAFDKISVYVDSIPSGDASTWRADFTGPDSYLSYSDSGTYFAVRVEYYLGSDLVIPPATDYFLMAGTLTEGGGGGSTTTNAGTVFLSGVETTSEERFEMFTQGFYTISYMGVSLLLVATFRRSLAKPDAV